MGFLFEYILLCYYANAPPNGYSERSEMTSFRRDDRRRPLAENKRQCLKVCFNTGLKKKIKILGRFPRDSEQI